MDYMGNFNAPIEIRLLEGLWIEAERADRVAASLGGLRSVLAGSFHGHLIAVCDEIRSSSSRLRELSDCSQIHAGRLPSVLHYINLVLPCLSRSLRDITTHYEDKTLSREIRWRKLCKEMTDEAGGLQLPQRFAMYSQFLIMIKRLLTRYQRYPHAQTQA
jgi:hypothetical protein